MRSNIIRLHTVEDGSLREKRERLGIVSSIPIPKIRQPLHQKAVNQFLESRRFVEQLTTAGVGDSFLSRLYTSRIYDASRKLGISVTTRTDVEKNIRVWRMT